MKKSKSSFEAYLEKVQERIQEPVKIPKELISKHPHQKDIEEVFEKMHEQNRSKTNKTS